MDYQDLYKQLKSELAVKHGVIIDENDPAILATYIQIQAFEIETKKIHDEYIQKLKELQHKIDENNNQALFSIKESKTNLDKSIAKIQEFKILLFSIVLVISCILCLFIGKTFL